MLHALISKWKYLYEIQLSYTDWTFSPKALRQHQVRERVGKIKILRVGPMWMRDGWRAPGTALSFHLLPGKCFICSFVSHVKNILPGTCPKPNTAHLWELKPAGTTVPVKLSCRHVDASPGKLWLVLPSTSAKACQQQQRKFRTKQWYWKEYDKEEQQQYHWLYHTTILVMQAGNKML